MARDETIPNRWTVGPYEIQEVEFHGTHPWAGQTMYRYTINGAKVDSELYPSLDRALVSAVGARHMGPRGAGGNAVGTAADWFCIMVGIKEDEERPAPPASPGFCEAGDCPWSAPHAAGLPDGCTGGKLAIPAECPGSGRGWMNVGEPKCRHCGIRPSELGLGQPELAGNVYRGMVPPHTLGGKA